MLKVKMFYYLFLIFILLQVRVIEATNCKSQQLSDYTYGTIINNTSIDSNSVFTASLKDLNLSTEQPICLSLEIDRKYGKQNYTTKNNDMKTEKLFQIHLMNSWQEYKIEKSYYFGLPNITADCKCYCENQDKCKNESTTVYCNSNKELMKKNIVSECFNIYSPHHECKHPLQDNGAICCRLSVIGNSSEKYKAIYINSMTSFHNLQLILKDQQDNTLWAENVTVTSNSHDFNFSKGDLNIQQFPIAKRLPETWSYVSLVKPNEVRTGVLLNDINETSVSKVGWYKWPQTAEDIKKYENEIRVGLAIDIMDCEKNNYEWQMKGYGFQSHIDKGILLHQFYKAFITSSQFIDQQMTVKVTTKDHVEFKLNVDLIVPTKLLIDEHGSHMDEMYATAEDIEENSTTVSVFVENCYGTLMIEVGNISKETIILPNINPRSYVHVVTIPERYSKRMIACVSTVRRQEKKMFHCKNVIKKFNLNQEEQNIDLIRRKGVNNSSILIAVVISMFVVGVILFLFSMKSFRHRLMGYTFLRTSKKSSKYNHLFLVDETELTIPSESNM